MPNRTSGLVLVFAAVSAVAATPPASLSRAIAAQEALLAARPGDAQAVNDHGNLLLLAGREDAAEEAYLRAVELNPHLQSARFNLALLLEQRGNLRAAREQLHVVVEALPSHAWAHFQLGRIAERQGREREAIRAYATAFRLDAGLSFPEVNPQVIDSELVTKALLKTHPDARVASEAPRMYEQPNRIASLLLPALPAETGEAVEEPLEAAEQAAPAESPRGVDESRAETEGIPKVLTPRDLQTGSRVGEATPAAPAQPGANRNQGNRERLQRATPRGQREGATSDRGYRPGTPSTGQSRLRIREDG